MPPHVSTGSSQATYVMSHPALTRNVAVTCGHSLIDWTGDEVQAANRLFDDFNENVVNGMDSTARFEYVDLFIGADVNPSGSVRSNRAATQGLAAYDIPPPNVAVLVQKRTAFFGRKARGRLYLPFMLDRGNTDEGGNIAAGVLSDIGAQMDAWFEALQLDDATSFGPLYPVINPTSSNPAVTAAPIRLTSFDVQPKVATQRRRLRR